MVVHGMKKNTQNPWVWMDYEVLVYDGSQDLGTLKSPTITTTVVGQFCYFSQTVHIAFCQLQPVNDVNIPHKILGDKNSL